MEKHRTVQTVKRSVVLWWFGVGAGGIDGEQKTFRAVKLCTVTEWWIHVIELLSKPVEYTPPSVNPNVSLGSEP